MEHQPDFDFDDGKKRKRRNGMSNLDVRELLMILRHDTTDKWLTAVVIITIQKRKQGEYEGKRFTRDYLRHLAKAAGGRVISGQAGYRWTQYATHDELQMAAGILLNNAQANMQRRSDLLFVFHNGRTRTQKEEESYDEQIGNIGNKTAAAPGHQGLPHANC